MSPKYDLTKKADSELYLIMCKEVGMDTLTETVKKLLNPENSQAYLQWKEEKRK